MAKWNMKKREPLRTCWWVEKWIIHVRFIFSFFLIFFRREWKRWLTIPRNFFLFIWILECEYICLFLDRACLCVSLQLTAKWKWMEPFHSNKVFVLFRIALHIELHATGRNLILKKREKITKTNANAGKWREGSGRTGPGCCLLFFMPNWN